MARDSIEREAARWFTRLQAAELPVDGTLKWQQWIALDPRHAEAFQKLEETWLAFSALPRPALLPREEIENDGYDGSVSVSEWNARRRGAGSQRRRFFFSLAASVVLATIVGTLWLSQRPGDLEVIETRIGENRVVTLADGSRIALGGLTRLEVELGRERRDVALTHGEALFTVAKDATRPFSVRTDSAEVTAMGTEFNVRRSADRVVVSVLEGRVMVQPMRAAVALPVSWLEKLAPVVPRGVSQALDAGHRATVDRSGMGETAQLPDASVAIAWRQGQLSFEDEPLRYVVDAVNRYSAKPIVIGDAAIGEMRFTGTVVGDHVDGWIASLETAFGVQALEDGREIRLVR